MRETGDWRPLFHEATDAETAEIWAVIRDIAAALQSSAPEEIPAAEAPHYEQVTGAGLSSGNAGLALFFCYLAQATLASGGAHDNNAENADTAADRAVECLDLSLEVVASRPMMPALYSGFTGVGWAMEHLQGRLFEEEEEEEPDAGAEEGQENPEATEANEADDEEATTEGTLLQMLNAGPWQGEYDLINGLVGFAIYGLEALPRPKARELLEKIVIHLEDLAEARPEGATWFTPPEFLPPHQRQAYPDGYYNLGVAHGVPGIVAALAEIHGASVLPERSLALLEKAVSWVLAQEWDTEQVGRCFPHFRTADNPPHPTRLAWCYGDPGIAVALFLAARHSGRKDWEERALEIAARAAARPADKSQVQDVGLCHGAAGLGHLFNRLYQATGREELGEAARFWFRCTLAMRRPGEGVGGFFSWDTTRGGWWPERGLLTGAAGVGLALLAAVSPVSPDWDRMLLTTVTPE